MSEELDAGLAELAGPLSPAAAGVPARAAAGLSTSAYRQTFATPGAWGFVTAGFVSRLPTSMLGLSLVLAITAGGRHYAVAGAASAAVALAAGACGPITGRLVDRYGQAGVLVVLVTAFAAIMSGLALAVHLDAPAWSLVPLALLAGAVMPVTSPLVRARWTKVLAGTDLLHTAYAVEGATTQVVFIAGPILVAFVATGIGPVPGLLTVLTCAVLGTLALAAQRGSQPEPHHQPTRRGEGVMRMTAMQLIFLVVFGQGAIIGSVEIITIARASQLGHRHLTGLLLGLYGIGSLVAGLLYGALPIRNPPVRRMVLVMSAAALLLVPLMFATDITSLAPLLAIAGATLSPATITANEIVQRAVPATAFTEGTFWLTTAIAFGMTVGNLLSGIAVTHRFAGNHLYLIPALFGAATAAVVLLSRRRLLPAE
ncbi:MAG TPA: MFS transporter [Jatrophihabitans sp.]|nr:MFS transporter [Jatrophihabitans sp.]